MVKQSVNSADQQRTRYVYSNSWIALEGSCFSLYERVLFLGETTEDLDLSVCVDTYTDTYTHMHVLTHTYTHVKFVSTPDARHVLSDFIH